MMRLEIVNRAGLRQDVTELVTSARWSGDIRQVARILEFGLLASSSDQNIPQITTELGNIVSLSVDGVEKFRGFLFAREKGYNASESRCIAYDGAIYLRKNKGAYNFTQMTPEAITRRVCTDFGLKVGHVEATNIATNHVAIGDEIYSIIMQAYTQASKVNGKKYFLSMERDAVTVREKGKSVLGVVLENGANITDSNFAESIENVVNIVKVVDDNGNKIGQIEDKDLQKLFGKFQDVYRREDARDANEVARNMLRGVERRASLAILGNSDCVTGQAVRVRDEQTGLVGLFHIDADSHEWSNGVYQTHLQLNFENIMDSRGN